MPAEGSFLHDLSEDRSASSRSFHPSTWWCASFRFLTKVGGDFAHFVRSFHRRPATTSSSGCTARMWPFPLPYPKLMVGSSDLSRDDISFKRGVNLVVAALNWLHLRRPRVCPLECVLFMPLSKLQWKVVRHIELLMRAWKTTECITSENMGRAAAKVENIDELLTRLSTFEDGVASTFEESQPSLSGSGWASSTKRIFARGLQRVSGGEFCGVVAAGSSLVAKPLKASRLEFRGVPEFDPSPFLDDLGRFIYEEPMQAALQPHESLVEIPRVKLYGKESEVWALLKKLDSSGRLGAIKESDIYPGYQAGLFSIGKDQSRDRLIFDSRPFNTLECPPGRWIASMASASNLTEFHLEDSEICLVSGTDLREFYYSFKITPERLARNSLLFQTHKDAIRDFQCYTADLDAYDGAIYLGLQTLAMGDTCAVELAQTAHLGVLYQLGLVSEQNLIAMNLSLPRSPCMLGIVIDDLIIFQRIAKGALVKDVPTEAAQKMTLALERFEALGLTPHLGKTFFDSAEAEFWGAHFDGDTGTVRAALKRVIPIWFATIGVVKLGVVTLGLLETLVGCWTSIFLFRRRMLSILNIVYTVLQTNGSAGDVLRLSAALQDELLLCISLAPLAVTYLRARNASHLYASDASSWGFAVVRAELPEWLQGEVHRHRLRKSVWTKLLSPVKKLQRLKGVLPPAEELPEGKMLPSHPIWVELATTLQFRTVKAQATRSGRHINLDELVGMIESERSAAFEHFPSRYFQLADSQVGLGAILKGRSSSAALNDILQQSLPIYLGCSMNGSTGFLPSETNPADDPTRKVPLREPWKSPLPWLDTSSEMSASERLDQMDQWLTTYSTEPWALSGLPGLQELSKPYEESNSWTARARSKQYWRIRKSHTKDRLTKKNTQFPLSSPEFKLVDDFAESLFVKTSHVAEPCGPETTSRDDLTPAGEGTCPRDRCYPELAQGPDRVGLVGALVEVSPIRSEKDVEHEQPCKDVADSPASCNNSADSATLVPAIHEPLKPSAESSTDSVLFSFPTACQKGVPALSVEAVELLKTVPLEQFVFPSHWKLPPGWRPDFAGYLDLFSGKKGVAKQVASRGDSWSLTFEIEDNPSQDLNGSENRRLVRRLLECKAVHTLGAAITCRSFSRAVRPPVRTRTEPKGLVNISPNMQKKVAEGNDQAIWLAGLVAYCITNSLFFWVENPDLSFLWWLPEWRLLGAHIPSNSFRLDYCTCGCPWKKRTRVFTNLWLKDHCLFCNKTHSHLRLVGWSKEYGLPWTRLAQEYPRRFCGLLADAILLDNGLIPFRRRMDVAGMARQTNRRIGEAANPGPRRRSGRSRRNLNLLLQTDLVEPQTALLGEKVWKAFRLWSLGRLSSEAFDVLSSNPATIGLLVESYGKFLFSEGQSLYILRQLITYIQRCSPMLRGAMAIPWQLVNKWEIVEPLKHRTPMPLVIYRAMVSVAFIWRWYRLAAICMLTFEGLCRPGETLNAVRADLLLCRDLVVEDAATIFLRIGKPKGRRRGIGTVQHTKISNLQLAKFLDWLMGDLDRRSPLYPGSPGAFRKRWDAILSWLNVPTQLALTPASLRSGGAIAAYRCDTELTKIMWTMRVRNIDTLQHYLQEMGAASIFAELPKCSRERIQSTALMFPALLDIF